MGFKILGFYNFRNLGVKNAMILVLKKKTEKRTDEQTVWQIDGQTDGWTERQIDNGTDRLTRLKTT